MRGGLAVAALLVLGAGAMMLKNARTQTPSISKGLPSPAEVVKVPFERQSIAVDPAVSKNFSLAEVKNLGDVEKAYGVVFTSSDKEKLERNKFVIKNLMDTNLTPVSVELKDREFASLYAKVAGADNYRARTPANAVFISSDVLANLFLYSRLSF